MERGTGRTLIGFVIGLTLWRPAAAPAQPAGAAHEVPAAITYSADVAPLVHRSCVPCHRPDGPAPFSLTTYEDVRRRASQIAAVTNDVFRNFVLPASTGGPRYVRGFEFRADSAAVHHANIRVDYTPASRALEEADPDPGYEGLVLRSADYSDGHFLGWTPGQWPPLAPEGLAWTLQEGADFVVQLHMRPTGKRERIRPRFGLFFTDTPPARTPAMLRLGRQNIDIPAGNSSHRSLDEYTLPVDVEIHAIQPHSHYRARTVRAWAELPDGSRRSLISISDWDFGWQDVYRVAAPYWLPAGSRIATEYVFDNSAGNPRNPESPPARALWGFRSADEMGDVWLQVMTRTAADRQVLVRHFGRKAMQEDVVGLEMQLAVNPDNAPLHDDAALLYLELGDADAAARHFAASARLRPAAAARFNLGTALEAGNRLGEAEAAYRAAFDIDPEYAPAHVNLGTIRLNQGRVSDALAHYREAIRLAPGNADARNNLGRLLAAQGDTAGARAHLEEALRLRPDHAAAHFNLGGVLLAGDEAARAAHHFRETIRLRPEWSAGYAALAWVLSAHPDSGVRRPDEAVRLARRAVELSSGSDAALYDAFALASTAKSPQLAAIQQRLSLYRAGRPYREMAPAPIR